MRIVIIKLESLGDVVRTLLIAIAIKKKFPKSELSWVTKRSAEEIVRKCKEIDFVYSAPEYPKGDFDILYNLDIESTATSLASVIKAKLKKGFYSSDGFPMAFNSGSEYYINTIFDDELKKHNKKTYEEMIFMAADISYNKEHFELLLSSNEKKYAKEFMKKNKIKTNKKIIGIHIGSSPRWPSKSWHENNIEKFIKLAKEKGFEIILFAGPDDVKKQIKILKNLEKVDIKVYANNPNNTILEFASLLDLCDFVICSDSLALHVSLALNKNTIALFFCTSPDEIESFGKLIKLVSPKLYEFFPERMNEYNDDLKLSIKPEEVLLSIDSLNRKRSQN